MSNSNLRGNEGMTIRTGLSDLEVFAPVRRSTVSTPMLGRLVAFHENFLGTVAIGPVTAAVGALGFFCIVIKRPFHAKNQAVIQMKPHFYQYIFNLFKRYVHDVVTDAQEGGGDEMGVHNTFNIR